MLQAFAMALSDLFDIVALFNCPFPTSLATCSCTLLLYNCFAVCVFAAGGPDYTAPSRNLALELVRVTEAAALAAARW